MSLRPAADQLIPEDTVRIAQAAFPKGSVYMRMRDALGPIYTDSAFAPLFPPAGSAGRVACPFGAGHRHAVCGRSHRSAGGGCSPQSD